MSPWHAALKRSSTLRAYFAGIADSVPQNTAARFSIIEPLVPGRLVFENTPAVPVLASSLETVVPSHLRAQSLVHPRFFKTVYNITGSMRLFPCARPPRGAYLRPNNSKDSVHGPYT